MQLAERLKRLGTETAFAVSAEAAKHVAAGHKVYPFHLGDMNIRTPRNIIEATYKAMLDGKTGYCPNYGIPALRELLAEDINKTHNTRYTMSHVAIQPGGKPSIGKFVQVLMNPGDEALYPNPGYPIYESQIQYHGGVAVPYTYHEGAENFEMDLKAIEAKITPRTKLLVLNDLQNPTGAEADPAQLAAIAEMAKRHNLFVLCDEAYFDIRYAGTSVSLASFKGMQERCVILYTFSKKYAMTGWRLGASIGPQDIIDAVAKLNVNDESCSNHFIQYGAIEALTGDQSGHADILRILKERRDIAAAILNTIPGVRCYRPNATFYLFPNVTGLMKAKKISDYETFRKAALHDTGVSFCTRRHFGTPIAGETEAYIRFAYSGINVDQIEEGLAKLKTWAQA
ncbi:MAG: aminotransferase class I/II-fold pyridoxal phosphate-dependent enzyme [Planctomycetales bacterium]|nr:aminotransferase class I/II-fold pyridoxal phosphate-dependent enzyme [Planctomycetales bacterium]